MDMKIRIGIGVHAWPFPERHASYFYDFIDQCDDMGVDSLWFSDRIIGAEGLLDPVVTMAVVAARSKKMKLGTSALVLPQRNPVVLAKELASLDFLSNGRLLLVVGLGQDDPIHYQSFGLDKKERGRRTDESIMALRKLWIEKTATFDGRYYSFRDVSIEPKATQQGGPPIWIGGRSDAALRRTGRLGDGWLSSAITPEESRLGVMDIRRYAAEAGRAIPEDHYGVSIQCTIADTRGSAEDIAAPYFASRRSDVAPETYSIFGTSDDIISRLKQYESGGITKFVLRPVCPPEQWISQVERLAKEVIHPIQTPFSEEELRERAGVVAP